MTWRNERAIEIPIVYELLFNVRLLNENIRILEVGNVLSHYFSVKYDIIDKYEKGKGVINEDIVTFNSNKEYDLIVCISTLEHIDKDYGEDYNPDKTFLAIENMKRLLAENGKLVITVPIGNNKDMDELIMTGKIKFDRMYCMKKTSFFKNTYIETDWNDIKDLSFTKGHGSNGLIIGIIYKNIN